MSVQMALVDYIPVVMFLITAVILQRDLYGKMAKGTFALFCAGTIMVFVAGFYKATWKLLYAAGICDFEKLNLQFFPLQSTGMLLTGVALFALFFFSQEEKGERLLSFAAAPAVYGGTLIFVVMMVLGAFGECFILSMIAKKMGRKKLMILFLVAFTGMISMGYLSSKDFSGPLMNWIGEAVNILAQGALMAGALGLHRAGLKDVRLK